MLTVMTRAIAIGDVAEVSIEDGFIAQKNAEVKVRKSVERF